MNPRDPKSNSEALLFVVLKIEQIMIEKVNSCGRKTPQIGKPMKPGKN